MSTTHLLTTYKFLQNTVYTFPIHLSTGYTWGFHYYCCADYIPCTVLPSQPRQASIQSQPVAPRATLEVVLDTLPKISVLAGLDP